MFERDWKYLNMITTASKCLLLFLEVFITYFKERNRKSKKKYENHETLSNLIKTVDTFVLLVSTSTSVTLLVTGLGLLLVQPALHVAKYWLVKVHNYGGHF